MAIIEAPIDGVTDAEMRLPLSLVDDIGEYFDSDVIAVLALKERALAQIEPGLPEAEKEQLREQIERTAGKSFRLLVEAEQV